MLICQFRFIVNFCCEILAGLSLCCHFDNSVSTFTQLLTKSIIFVYFFRASISTLLRWIIISIRSYLSQNCLRGGLINSLLLSLFWNVRFLVFNIYLYLFKLSNLMLWFFRVIRGFESIHRLLIFSDITSINEMLW